MLTAQRPPNGRQQHDDLYLLHLHDRLAVRAVTDGDRPGRQRHDLQHVQRPRAATDDHRSERGRHDANLRPRERLTSRQVGLRPRASATTRPGCFKQVTLPDSSYVLYTYDTAHRLTQITDGAGNSIQYTLDAMGNRTAEKTYDPSRDAASHAHARLQHAATSSIRTSMPRTHLR